MAVLLGLVLVCAGLVVSTVLVRGSRPAPTTTDLARVEAAALEGCPASSALRHDPAGFALDGVVREVAPAADGRPSLVVLEVREWFRGPPVDRVEVSLPATTVHRLAGDGTGDGTGEGTGGETDGGTDDGAQTGVGPGTRLLVSGHGWGGGRRVLDAGACGGTLAYDPTVAAAWRDVWRGTDGPTPLGPAARYTAVGFVRGSSSDAPALTGVLLLDRGCLYVDDGLTRWVPVFPDHGVGWVPTPPQLQLAGGLVDVGHQVRLPGVPATGVVQRAARPLRAEESMSRTLDEAGVPPSCDRVRPRFVVSEPAPGDTAQAQPVPSTDPLVEAARRGADRAGLGAGSATAESRLDLFGAQSVRMVLRTRALGDVLVHLENVAVLAWPLAYAASDARIRWSVDPADAPSLPEPPPGAQLAAVDRADGSTQLLLRTGDRVVVSVTADLPSGPGGRVGGLQSLVDVATEVALTRGGGGS